MQKLKKLGVLSVAKLQAVIMAVFGLVIGIFYATLGPLMRAVTGSPAMSSQLGVLAIIILPIFYGILGFVFGAIGALLYNLFAKWLGGIEVELE